MRGPDVGSAKADLRRALALHQKHMDGTEPTTGPAGKRSQEKLMMLMETALAALEGGRG